MLCVDVVVCDLAVCFVGEGSVSDVLCGGGEVVWVVPGCVGCYGLYGGLLV